MFLLQWHYFQGEFTHWLDNTIMLQTSWYKSSINLPQYELSFYSISTNSSRKTHTYITIDVIGNQPSTNTKDNCTDAVTDPSADLRADFIWVIIPCNKSFEATFLCMNPIQAKPVNFQLALNPLNPLSPHDALKHHFTSLKIYLIFLQLRVSERKFPWNWFTNML